MNWKTSKSLEDIVTNKANTFVTVYLILPISTTGILKDLMFSLKDNFTVKGMLTTAGSKILHNYHPSYSCTVFNLLHDASAVFVGKNSLDEFGAGAGNNSLLPVSNLYDLTSTTGGSSSGSASAVSGNQVDFAISSDTGGSTRHPAHYCKVIGFKPSQRQISRYGLIAMADPLDCVGIISKELDIISKVYKVLNQKDEKGSRNKPLVLDSGIIDTYILLNQCCNEIYNILSSTFKIHQSSNSFSGISETYKKIMLPYFYSNLNRYDGIKFNNFKFNVAFNNQIIIQNRTALLNNESKYRVYAGFAQAQFFKYLTNISSPLKNNCIWFIEIKNSENETYSKELELANVFDLCAILIPITNHESLQILATAGHQYTILNIAKQLLSINSKTNDS